MFAKCGDCCPVEGDGNQQHPTEPQQQAEELRQQHLAVPSNAHLHATSESVRSVTIEEHTERSRAVAVSEQTERQWVRCSLLQKGPTQP